MIKLCFATNNAHKLEEIKLLLREVEIISLQDIGHLEDVPEDYDTMEANSLQKAQYIFDRYRVETFADDSGLEVDVLGGAPGVYSARYAGPQRDDKDNFEKLLQEMADFSERTARFKAVISLVTHNKSVQFTGTVEGKIAKEAMGNNGFGYDPVFIPDGYSTTFAQMDDLEKNKISHRARAIAKLVEYISDRKS